MTFKELKALFKELMANPKSRKRIMILGGILVLFFIIVLWPKEDPSVSRFVSTPTFVKGPPGSGGDSLNNQSGDDFGKQTEAEIEQMERYKDTYIPVPSEEKTATQKLEAHLPIYIEDFETSVGIPTSINVYTVPSDPVGTIHLEIYNINYQNRDWKSDGAAAFVESFKKAKEEIEKTGADFSKFTVVYGTQEYMHSTAEFWIKTHNLL